MNYSLSPEARFPVASEECYDTVVWVANEENAQSISVDPRKIVIAGDSAGGYLAATASSTFAIIQDLILRASQY